MVRRTVRGRGAVLATVAVVMTTLFVARPATATAAPWPPTRLEFPVPSLAPDAHSVLESEVALYDPLPSADGPRPPACDWITYLRFRSARGPADPSRADAIFVAQPGIYEGAGALDQVARNTVTAAAAHGRSVEFWALDRRSTCLDDNFGIEVATAARDPQLALDYYYGGKAVDGHTFAGFVSEADAGFLAHVGLAQTVEDEEAVIAQLPPAVRRTKVLCGGHSLGGIITGAFADWDFSGTGNPAGAGYNQCAGFFALDTRFQIGDATTVLDADTGTLDNAITSSVSAGLPYLSAGPFSPEVFAAIPILGMAAYFDPDQLNTSVVSQLPDDSTFDLTYRLLFAGSYPEFESGQPDIRQFRVTNQATIGFLFGDVSQPIGILRASVGVPTGGPVVEKSFPVPYGTPSELNGLLGGNDQITPDPASATPDGPVYSWLNYDQVPTPGPAPADDPGHPYTSAASEVSDITQLDRALFDAPARFTEDYFPTQLVLDIDAAGQGDRSGTLAGLRYSQGANLRPTAYVDAAEGIAPSLGPVPAGAAHQVHVVAPGYNHLDVVTAAYRQTDGQPEVTSATLASWAAAVRAAEPSRWGGGWSGS